LIDAVLFDFFGTLVGYSPSRVEQGYHATHALLLQHDIALTYTEFLEHWVAVSETLDAWSRQTGREFSMQQVAVEFLAEVCPRPYAPSLPTDLWQAYVAEWGTAIRYLPGVRELVADLSSHLRVGVVTNTHATSLVQEHLTRSGIAPHVEVVVTSVDHGRPKPHPSIFAAALERLGSTAASTLFVGDSYEADYRGARRAGLPALLIDPAGAAPIPAADRIASVLDVRERLALPR
jgi:putative hydrolase of the HAD superfamily